jgi:hypothetical protein
MNFRFKRFFSRFKIMKILVPSEEEQKRAQKKKHIHGIYEFLFGVIFFGLAGTRIFRYGFDEVESYTWITLGLGVISFTCLAWKFGNEFWQSLFRNSGHKKAPHISYVRGF